MKEILAEYLALYLAYRKHSIKSCYYCDYIFNIPQVQLLIRVNIILLIAEVSKFPV